MKHELIGGLTTFFTMAYILVVNPSILSTPGTGMPFSGVMTATVLLCFSGTLLMGLYAKLPFAVAPGMGLNAFFTFSIVIGQGVPWQTALGMVFWSGVLFLIASVTNIRVLVAEAIPSNLRFAIAVGIGLFLTLIGLKNAGLVVGDPVTLVKFGSFSSETLLSLVGLTVTGALMIRRESLAFLVGIMTVTFLSWVFGLVKAPQEWTSAPDFSSVLFKADIVGALQLSLVPAIISVFLTDLFDSLSTFIGVSQACGLVDEEGRPERLKEGLTVDALATFGAGLLGTSPGTAYIESAAGIDAGGRTGLAAVVTAFCFLPCLFFSPVAAMVPAYATAPVLILVGASMFRAVGALRLSQLEDSIPAFLTIVLIPLTFSITQGILWGFISHVALYFFAGRRRELTPMVLLIFVVAIGLLVLEHRF